jgi:hypothetical protein
MKKLASCAALIVFFFITVSSAPAIEYAVDHLEKGNTGGTAASLKTFDQKGVNDASKEILLDVWVKDVPEELITAGFWLTYDASKMKISKIDVYDGASLPGPWDTAMSRVVANPTGPGVSMVIAGNLGTVKPDKKGDIIIARVNCSCQDRCTSPIEIKPIRDFATIVGGNGKLYDGIIKPAIFYIHAK